MVDTDAIIPAQYTNETNPQSNQESSNAAYCSTCQLNFFDKTEYERHKKETHAKKKYPCFYCDSSFHRQDHLKRHINSLHSTSINSPVCPVCGQEFNDRDLLYDHVKSSHSDENSFYCRECFFRCESMAGLEEHENVHLLMIKHVCSYCSKPFKRRDHMLRHIKTIHQNYIVKCPKCSQVFKRNDHVTRHCREKHKIAFVSEKVLKTQINENGVSDVDVIKITDTDHVGLSL